MVEHQRNSGSSFDIDWINSIRINRSAIERRASSIGGRRAVKKEHQIAWMLHAVRCIDLTTLAGDDTKLRVKRLISKAKNPIRQDVLGGLEVSSPISCASVCVYHNMVSTVSDGLQGSSVGTCAVSTGFPAGQIPHEEKIRQIQLSVSAGATEIDIVISRAKVLVGDWKGLFEEVKDFRQACGPAHLKTILATGELATLRQVAQASLVCMMAGADFIKTSTGKEKVNATLPVGITMVRMIRDYYQQTENIVGFKPAGGISSAKVAVLWLAMIKEELGEIWMQPKLFRFGASSLLGDIERQLEFHLSGRYSASNRHPVA
ncbi:MAG: deoxyribose-phosphate aldolase [Euryarchaeota archaeon]|jgi:deoxyribose-phosphate aldolase|nr:deoxyribose-phosphate aldolase [Euryarchaeota archaeon]MBT3971983.1 deoxyribose-phosphate aldolase [Euryarchaeota archaeon]MBT4406920.1 deoxyribose-phosphate aldolase [Euryarchaeota archaeon]